MRTRRRNETSGTLPLPATFDDLVRAGGPRAYVEAAARNQAEQEARFWLAAVRDMQARMDKDDIMGAAVAAGYIKELRRKLRERPTLKEARGKTRERVRRHRERRRGMSEAAIAAERETKQRRGDRLLTMSALGPQKLGNASAAVRYLAGQGQNPTAEAISELMGMPVATAAAALETLRVQGHYDRIVSEASLDRPRGEG
jgi:hypothetical protein